VLRHAVTAFTPHPRIDGVQVVIRGDDRAPFDAATVGLPLLPPMPGEQSGRIQCGSGSKRSFPTIRPGY
jgi:hypothetical protein